MKRLLFLHIIFGLSIISCRKIEPTVDHSQSNDPVYKVNGTRNGLAIDLSVNDTTVFISDAIGSMNGIQTYSSEIKNSANNEAIRVIFTQSERPIQSIENYNITDKTIDFLVHKPKSFKFNFGNNQTAIDSLGLAFNSNYQSGDYEFEYNEYGIYSIACSFIGSNNFHYILNNGFVNNELSADFTITTDNGNFQNCTPQTLDFSHKWYINDPVSYETGKTINGLVFEDSLYWIKHVIIDEYGNSSEHTKYFFTEGHEIAWYLTAIETDNNPPIQNYGKLMVEYDYDGETYTSAYQSVNLNEDIQITDISFFIVGSKVVSKFTVKFDCRLSNLSGTKFIDLSDIEGTFKYQL